MSSLEATGGIQFLKWLQAKQISSQILKKLGHLLLINGLWVYYHSWDHFATFSYSLWEMLIVGYSPNLTFEHTLRLFKLSWPWEAVEQGKIGNTCKDFFLLAAVLYFSRISSDLGGGGGGGGKSVVVHSATTEEQFDNCKVNFLINNFVLFTLQFNCQIKQRRIK